MPKKYRPKQRTSSQNSALHKGFELIAKALNEAGLDMRVVLKPEIEIPWTKSSVKEHIWRPVQILMLSKQSTTQLAKLNEIEDIWDVVMRHLGQNHGVEYIPFPYDPLKPAGTAEDTPYLDEIDSSLE